jgi:hypothetical protein
MLGSGSIAGEQFDVARLVRDARGEHDLKAKLLRQAPSPPQQVACGIEAPLYRLELRTCPQDRDLEPPVRPRVRGSPQDARELLSPTWNPKAWP